MSIWANIIKRFKAPALPIPAREYDANYFNQLLNVLRLYFNQLDNLLEQIVSASPVNVNFYGAALDAFGRARFSQPFTLFDSQNRYQQNDLFSETTAVGGSVSYVANASTVNLEVTASSGSEVVRQTYRSFSYQPGKSLLVMNTFVMPEARTNQRIRIGYFNTENGVFLERDGTSVYITRRTYVSGMAVDTRVAQADWNGDKLNGTGASTFTLDLTKAQIFWQDFEWLGVGSVRCGFIIDGQTIICHTFQNANKLTSVYMTTAILPIRYEITNTAASTGSILKQICSTVISEGGYEKRVNLNVARMTLPNTSISTSFIPLVSIQLASGRTGAVVLPDGYSALCSGTNGEFEIALFKNPTLTWPGLPGWTPSDSPNIEYDVSATAMTGGTMVRNTYASSGAQVGGSVDSPENYNWNLQIGATIGGTSDIYTLAVRTLSGTHNAIGSLSFWDLT